MSEFETAEVRRLVEQRLEAIRAKDVERSPRAQLCSVRCLQWEGLFRPHTVEQIRSREVLSMKEIPI
jgi:hypothetical protein